MAGYSHAGFSNVDMLDLLMGQAVMPHGLALDQRQQSAHVDKAIRQQRHQHGLTQYGMHHSVATPHQSIPTPNNQLEASFSQKQVLSHHELGHKLGTHHQKQGNTHDQPENLTNSESGMPKPCSTQGFEIKGNAPSASQSQVSEPHTILNRVKTHTDNPDKGDVTPSTIQTCTQPQDVYPNKLTSNAPCTQSSSQHQMETCNRIISKIRSSDNQLRKTEIALQNTNALNDSSEQNSTTIPNGDQNSTTIPNGEQTSHHNKYLCPCCKMSILYFNRKSLIQLLSLHQQKCPGNKEYRYMCLECHSAFKTVIQLQAHESKCSLEFLNGGDVDSKSLKNSTRNPTNHTDVRDLHASVKDDDEKLFPREQSETNKDVVAATKVFVRESWTQTTEQSDSEGVDILLGEISPAGRKRRSCARKVKVYNEKEMAHQIENAELEMIEAISTRKEARACKKDLKRFVKGNKLKKKLGGDIEVVPSEGSEQSGKEGMNKVKMKKDKEVELEVPLQCQLCPKMFKKYSMYTKHYQLNHEKAMCQYCGVQCIRKKLKQHEKTHLRTFKCPHVGCTRVLNSKHRLKRHLRIHTGEKPYTCDVCGKPFAGKENMVKHKKRVHDKERKYECRYCGQKFADKGGLKYHENTHTKERPTDYRCKFCGRGYKSHVGCYLHERTHTGNTYKCTYCGKDFMAKVHLRKHEYIHTGNYPFRCGNCHKGFPNNGMLKKHKCLAVL